MAGKTQGGKAPFKTGRVFFLSAFWCGVSPFVSFSWQVCRVREKPQQTFVFVRKNPEKPLVSGGTNKTSWRSRFFLFVFLGGEREFSTLVAD